MSVINISRVAVADTTNRGDMHFHRHNDNGCQDELAPNRCLILTNHSHRRLVHRRVARDAQSAAVLTKSEIFFFIEDFPSR